MRKVHAVSLAVMLAAGAAIAQPANTATTTGAAVAANNSSTTGSARAGAGMFTKEMFEKRWQMEESMYREAGISEEKIQKLHDLNLKIWDARSSGEKADFQEIMKQRSQILDKDEIEKLRNLRRKQIEKQLGHELGSTTATRSFDRPTTIPAADK